MSLRPCECRPRRRSRRRHGRRSCPRGSIRCRPGSRRGRESRVSCPASSQEECKLAVLAVARSFWCAPASLAVKGLVRRGRGDAAEPLVAGVVIPLITSATRGLLVPYSSTLDVPHELVEHVSWLIHARRQELNSPWRHLGCCKQALPALAHLRKNERFPQLAAGFGVSTATAWRYVDETLKVLAAWTPGPHEALVGMGEDDFVIVEGTLIPTDRIAADEPGRPDRPRRRRHRPHSLLPPQHPAPALPAVQPRPRPTPSTGRTRLRTAEDLARPPPDPLPNQPHQPHRCCGPYPHHLRKHRMKKVQ